MQTETLTVNGATTGTGTQTTGTHAKTGIEWLTLGLILAVHLAWGAATWLFHDLPLWIALPVSAFFVALHSSLQHEALHGHPTRNRRVNELLVSLPLGLAIPYRPYRASHLKHHCDERLTDPYDDPESYYLTQSNWRRLSPILRTVYAVNNTLLGRLLVGPALVLAVFWGSQARRAVRTPIAFARDWLPHLAGLAVMYIWVVMVCDISAMVYVFGVAYPGMSLILLRSFAEHQAHEKSSRRTVVVETNPVLALLFLNNNLHFAHHKYPHLAWYCLPKVYRREADLIAAENGGYRFRGYGEIIRKHLLRAKESVPHPHV